MLIGEQLERFSIESDFESELFQSSLKQTLQINHVHYFMNEKKNEVRFVCCIA